MENPFEILNERLERIETLLESISSKIGATPLDIPGIPDNMNLNQLKDYLGLSKSHIYKLTATHEIPHYKRGKRLFFDKDSINAWVKEHRVWTMDDIKKQAADYLIKHPIKRY